jgi:Mor family transcriptional regulator
MVGKGRHWTGMKGPAGEENGQAVLSTQKAARIREKHAAGHSYRRLAQEYGVAFSTIRDVVKEKTWKTE